MTIMLKTLPLIATFALVAPPLSFAAETPVEFFDKYESLSNHFDASVADLYSDDAEIHAYRKQKGQVESELTIDGAKWKLLMRQAMPLAKAQDDRNTYSNIDVVEMDNGYRINATRYSTKKCYYDSSYYMVIEPSQSGDFKITQEHITTQYNSGC
jgi:hypothetical protein